MLTLTRDLLVPTPQASSKEYSTKLGVQGFIRPSNKSDKSPFQLIRSAAPLSKNRQRCFLHSIQQSNRKDGDQIPLVIPYT